MNNKLLEGQDILSVCYGQAGRHSQASTVNETELYESDNILENKLKDWEKFITLTKREKEILMFVLAGKTNREIAQSLYRTERTVEYHRNRMMRKLGTHNIVELVKRAVELGII